MGRDTGDGDWMGRYWSVGTYCMYVCMYLDMCVCMNVGIMWVCGYTW